MTARANSRRPDAKRQYAIASAMALVIVAGILYLSYTAVSGFPWESTYKITVNVPNAKRLQANNDVRIGGVRVGRVEDVTPMPASGDTAAFARVDLALSSDHDALPVDTAVRVRPASVLGASYVDLVPGRSTRTLPEGGRLSLARAGTTVDVTDLFDVFDRRTARSMQRTFSETAAGFAGRGEAFNEALAALDDALAPWTRVLETLAAEDTELGPFIASYQRFMDALAPVHDSLAGIVEGGSDTFGAFADESAALGAGIDEFPRAELATTRALTALQPQLDTLADLATDLLPAGDRLPGSVGALNGALDAGVGPIRDLPQFARRLDTTLDTARRVTGRKSTDGAVRKITETLTTVEPAIDLVLPAQVECNIIGNFWPGFGDLFSYGTGEGPGMVLFDFTHAGAIGETFQASSPSPNIGLNIYPNETEHECESGNELHDGINQFLNNPPGYQGKAAPPTYPQPGSIERARSVGLIDLPEAAR